MNKIGIKRRFVRRTFPPCFLFLIPYLLIASSLFARGKTEETEKIPLNNEWVLCVTNFTANSLSADKTTVAEVITRSLVDTLKVVSHRVRISPEYAYYEGYALAQQRSAAAKALAAKQEERALFLYRGEPDWRYRQNIKKIDADIVKLQEAFAKAESEIPVINQEPAFNLTQANKEGNFPEVPKEGGEYRFCQGQRADSFLSGTIPEYHDRYYVTLRLYALYTRSYIYEDSVIFSADDLSGSVDEIAGRLIAVLAGTRPAAVAIHADPPETLVLINQNFAGRGEMETREYPPGKIITTFSAPGHDGETVETELEPGMLTQINVNLRPTEYSEVNIAALGYDGANVYQGSLFVGKAPLTLRLPLNQLEYINMETNTGEAAKIVFNTPASAAVPYTFSMRPKIPPSSGQNRVNNARRWYYWAWGSTWITGIATWLTLGMYTGSNDALRYGSFQGIYNEKFYEDSKLMYGISIGAAITLGVVVGYEIFQMARYIYIATEDTTPIVKPDRTGSSGSEK
jgi:hypothetical protein